MATKRTTDHDTIRRWVEERCGQPTRVEAGADVDTIRLYIDFPGYGQEPTLEPVKWDTFFTIFEDAKLELVYEERTDTGKISYFNKFVERDVLPASS